MNDNLDDLSRDNVPAFVCTFFAAHIARDIVKVGSSNILRIAISPLLDAHITANDNQFYGCKFYCDDALNGLSWRIEQRGK